MSANSSLQPAAASDVPRKLSNSPPVEVLAMLLLFSVAAWHESVQLSALADSDVWWHLSTGAWILQNHTVPHTGLFSQYPDLPWIASNWLFDVLLAAAYKLVGISALVIFLMAFKVTIAVLMFALARGSRLNFWPAVLLGATAQYSIPDLPGPIVWSVVLFAIELKLLFRTRRTGKVRPLFWVPFLFLVWANVDMGFMFGLFVLFLFSVIEFAEEIRHCSGAGWFAGQVPRVPLRIAAIVTAASVIATFCNPYFFHLYSAACKELWSIVPYVHGLRAISFRRPQDYVLLLLAMAAFFFLGRQRSQNLFEITLMIGCLALAFTRRRDTWLLAVASVAVIAYTFPISSESAEMENGGRMWRWEKLVTAGLVIFVFALAAITQIPGSGKALLKRIGETFPVRASDYIRANHLPSPLFNAYDWGGFLTWYLPEYPVSIDSRTGLYGEGLGSRYFKITTAEIPLDVDPSFANAPTILLPKDSPMAIALSTVPRFQVAYQDNVAMVLLQGR